MNKLEHQRWPDGTRVRFTDEALIGMSPKGPGDFTMPEPLRMPDGGASSIFTIDNTDDIQHDVILRENGERWGVYWLRELTPADDDSAVASTPLPRLKTGDRVRHQRGWYGRVVADRGGEELLVRFDDGSPLRFVDRAALRLVDDLDTEVLALIDPLREFRQLEGLPTSEAALLDRVIEMLPLMVTERGMKVRVAAEIDRLVAQIVTEPFEPDVAKKTRVRQWFADGANWSLTRLQHLARPDRPEDSVESQEAA